MNDVLKYRTSLVMLALVNMLPALEVEESRGLLGIAVGSAVLGLVSSSLRYALRPPVWIIQLMVLGAVANLFYEMLWPTESPTVYIVDLSHFIVLLCCCKFFELRSARDMALVLLISFLLMVIGAFVSASALFGAVLALDVTAGIAWLLCFQHAKERAAVADAQRAALTHVAGDSLPVYAPAPAPIGTIFRAASFCSLCLLIAAMVCFVVVPRGWGRGWVGRLQRLAPATITGFDEEVRLRDVPIFEDESIVMRVSITRSGTSPDPKKFTPHMRGLTFDRYADGAWQRTSVAGMTRLTVPPENAALELDSAATFLEESDLLIQNVWLERIARGVIFAEDSPVTLSTTDISEINQNPLDLTLQTPDRLLRSINYEVRSRVGEQASPVVGISNRALRRPIRSASDIDPKVREFAQGFCATYGDPTDSSQQAFLARKICAFLSSGAFQYTLNRPETPTKTDPVKNFLLDSRLGHCEYFASAMTMMCQAVGIPARLVSGYAGGEYNSVGGFWQMRRKDAHAWVEVFLPGREWVAFDPSPASLARKEVQPDGLLAQAMRFVDYVRFKWSSAIVTFDTQSRYDLKDRFAKWLSQLISREETQITFGQAIVTMLWGPEMIPLWQRVFYWLLLILCAVFAVLMGRIAWIVSLMVRELLPRRAQHGGRQQRRSNAKFYDRILVLLANKGYAKPGHVTPREFAAQVSQTCPDLSQLPQFVEWFYEAQFGRRSLGNDRWESLRDFLQRLREDRAFGVKP